MVVFPVCEHAGFIDGFRREQAYFQLGLIGFAILYTPVSMVLGLVMMHGRGRMSMRLMLLRPGIMTEIF